jgi:hypothetical protein
MNEKWLIALLPIVVGLLLVPATAEDITVTADVPYYVSVVFNYNTVNFGTVAPGQYVEAPNQNAGIYNVTVTTNVPLTVSAYRTAWSPADIFMLVVATTMDPSQVPMTYYEISISPRTIATDLPTGRYTHYHKYWLSVPTNAPPGTYSTTVTITYTPA